MFRIPIVYLLLYVTYIQNFKKKKMLAYDAAAGAKFGKMTHFPQQQEPHIYHYCL